MLNLVIVELMEKSPVILPCSLYIALFCHCLKSCLRCYEVFFSLSFGILCFVLAALTIILTVFNFIYWSHITRKKQYQRKNLNPTDEEYYCWIHLFSLAVVSSWSCVARIIWPTSSWREISINLLVSFTLVQMAFIVMVTGYSSFSTILVLVIHLPLLSFARSHCTNECNCQCGDAVAETNVRKVCVARDKVRYYFSLDDVYLLTYLK